MGQILCADIADGAGTDADPKELVEALKPFSHAPQSIIVVESTDTLILRDYAENVARMLEMVNRIDILTPNSVKPEIIPIRYALAADIASALSAYPSA